MDPELKTLLGALVEGQVKLAEGQAKTDASVARLVDGQAKTDASLARLAEGQAKTDASLARLADQVGKLTGEVFRMGARLDGFSEAVIRGFTDSAATDGEFRARFERLDARVSELEKHTHP